jgi:hypothetical protein
MLHICQEQATLWAQVKMRNCIPDHYNLQQILQGSFRVAAIQFLFCFSSVFGSWPFLFGDYFRFFWVLVENNTHLGATIKIQQRELRIVSVRSITYIVIRTLY